MNSLFADKQKQTMRFCRWAILAAIILLCPQPSLASNELGPEPPPSPIPTLTTTPAPTIAQSSTPVPAIAQGSWPTLDPHASAVPGPVATRWDNWGGMTPVAAGNPPAEPEPAEGEERPNIVESITRAFYTIVFPVESMEDALRGVFSNFFSSSLAAAESVFAGAIHDIVIRDPLSTDEGEGGVALDRSELYRAPWSGMLRISAVLWPLTFVIVITGAAKQSLIAASPVTFADTKQGLLDWLISVVLAGGSLVILLWVNDLFREITQAILATDFGIFEALDAHAIAGTLLSGAILDGLTQLAPFGGLFIAFFLIVLAISVLISLFLAYLAKYALLFILVVIAPFILTISVLPPTRWINGMWAKAYLLVSLLGPINALLLKLAALMSMESASAAGELSLVAMIVHFFRLLGVLSVLLTINFSVAKAAFGAINEVREKASGMVKQVAGMVLTAVTAGAAAVGGAALAGGALSGAGAAGGGGGAAALSSGATGAAGSQAAAGIASNAGGDALREASAQIGVEGQSPSTVPSTSTASNPSLVEGTSAALNEGLGEGTAQSLAGSAPAGDAPGTAIPGASSADGGDSSGVAEPPSTSTATSAALNEGLGEGTGKSGSSTSPLSGSRDQKAAIAGALQTGGATLSAMSSSPLGRGLGAAARSAGFMLERQSYAGGQPAGQPFRSGRADAYRNLASGLGASSGAGIAAVTGPLKQLEGQYGAEAVQTAAQEMLSPAVAARSFGNETAPSMATRDGFFTRAQDGQQQADVSNWVGSTVERRLRSMPGGSNTGPAIFPASPPSSPAAVGAPGATPSLYDFRQGAIMSDALGFGHEQNVIRSFANLHHTHRSPRYGFDPGSARATREAAWDARAALGANANVQDVRASFLAEMSQIATARNYHENSYPSAWRNMAGRIRRDAGMG